MILISSSIPSKNIFIKHNIISGLGHQKLLAPCCYQDQLWRRWHWHGAYRVRQRNWNGQGKETSKTLLFSPQCSNCFNLSLCLCMKKKHEKTYFNIVNIFSFYFLQNILHSEKRKQKYILCLPVYIYN